MEAEGSAETSASFALQSNCTVLPFAPQHASANAFETSSRL